MATEIRWTAQGQPISTRFDDVYFSTDNGLQETDYVFLQHNQLAQRFRALSSHSVFIIGETGFGTGLNFLACCRLWSSLAPKGAQLHFISVEKYPLDISTLTQALTLWPELKEYSNALIKAYPALIEGVHRLTIGQNIRLTLLVNEAVIGLSSLLASSHPLHQYPQWQGVDAWFLDGFAPSKNPDMWSPELFAVIAKLSKTGTTLATFTAAGHVRRGLSAVGFSIDKTQGYGHKRDMTIGIYSGETEHCRQEPLQSQSFSKQSPHKPDSVPWMLIDHYQPVPSTKTVAIIGGGIAGCHSAYALACKGYQVSLFEKANHLAAGASGNLQGVVYGKLSVSNEPQGDFNLYSLLYAQRFYRSYWQATPASSGQRCGILQLGITDQLQQLHQRIAQRFQHSLSQDLHWLTRQEASKIANTRIDYPALFFPNAGWINPFQLCQWLSAHPNITVIPNTDITRITHQQDNWLLFDKDGAAIKNQQQKNTGFHSVIIANAYDATRLSQTQTLPLKNIRGQVSHLPTSQASTALTTVVCGKGYIAPSYTQQANSSSPSLHCIGATFTLQSTNTQLDINDHRQNLQYLAQQTPELAYSLEETNSHSQGLSGRVGFRCATPDYLPIVGAVPITAAMQERYQALAYNARSFIEHTGCYYPNLYINVGHGSRGLAYTPLCSEIIASVIQGEPPPLPQALAHKLNPARFIIRQLIRTGNKT